MDPGLPSTPFPDDPGSLRSFAAARRRGGKRGTQVRVKDMTEQQALAEAVRRWGATGTIKFRPSRVAGGHRGRLARYCCTVGNGVSGSFYSIEGQGNSWREAFDDARPR